MKKLLISFVIGLYSTLLQAAEPQTTVPLIPSGPTAYKVTVFVEGAGNRDFLFDTGAGYMAINEEILGILLTKGLAVHVRDIQGVLANGTLMQVPLYRLTSINIGGVCILKDVEAAVFPGKTPGLMGLNALAKTAPFMFSITPPSLQLSNCQHLLDDQLLANK